MKQEQQQTKEYHMWQFMFTKLNIRPSLISLPLLFNFNFKKHRLEKPIQRKKEDQQSFDAREADWINWGERLADYEKTFNSKIKINKINNSKYLELKSMDRNILITILKDLHQSLIIYRQTINPNYKAKLSDLPNLQGITLTEDNFLNELGELSWENTNYDLKDFKISRTFIFKIPNIKKVKWMTETFKIKVKEYIKLVKTQELLNFLRLMFQHYKSKNIFNIKVIFDIENNTFKFEIISGYEKNKEFTEADILSFLNNIDVKKAQLYIKTRNDKKKKNKEKK